MFSLCFFLILSICCMKSTQTTTTFDPPTETTFENYEITDTTFNPVEQPTTSESINFNDNIINDGSTETTIITTTTTEEPCEKPEINVFDIEKNKFSFNWTITNANINMINVIDLGPAYEYPDGCNYNNYTETNITSNDNSYIYLNAQPYFTYKIEVTFTCPKEESETIEEIATTDESEPGPLTNFTITPKDEDIYVIEWNAPCDVNRGSLKEFKIIFQGSYTENSTIVHNSSISIPIKKNQAHYEQPVNDSIIKPSYKYFIEYLAIADGDVKGLTLNYSYTSPVGIPKPPTLKTVESLSDTTILIIWEEPEEKRGKITTYNVEITSSGPDYNHNDCRPNESAINKNSVDGKTLEFEWNEALPYSKYSVCVSAATEAGPGECSNTIETRTEAGNSLEIRNPTMTEIDKYADPYKTKLVITFEEPCDTRGPLENYTIDYIGQRINYRNDTRNVKISDTNYTMLLKPDYKYNISISANDNVKTLSHLSSPGFVALGKSNGELTLNDTYLVYFTISKDMFDETNGIVQYYAIILLDDETNITNTRGVWYENNTNQWPKIENECQTTPDFWNPFVNESSEVVWILGNEQNSNCSNHLKKATFYKVFLRALTSQTWSQTNSLRFRTYDVKEVNLGLAVGLPIGICTCLGVVGYVVYFIKYKKKTLGQRKARESNHSPLPITCKKLMQNYNIAEQYEELKAQFQQIGIKCKQFELESTAAVLPENKRKNRYANILPYDETRVKLKIEEDDDLGSDYINASFIRGYSNSIEYIATQGPLRHTCKDFWKMVVQENVSIIAMVSQFIEQDKEKCFQYFPSNGHTETYADNLTVRCVTELHFGTYCVRTLQVTKDNNNYQVTHMQFLEWPDFGVPDGTSCMLDFCKQIRESARRVGGLILVHCSAGVGRTGTLIATDILLQTIEDHRNINVFKTVLELRKQRINMVQTEKQYIFIYSCLKDSLSDPLEVTQDYPLYQNLEEIANSDTQSPMTKGIIDQETGF